MRRVVAEFPELVSAGAVEVVLSRALGRSDEARSAPFTGYGSILQTPSSPRGGAARRRRIPASWPHLAADPDRVLALAVEYMALGLWSDALELLDRRYQRVPGLLRSRAPSLPQDHPLVAYYRGYCRERRAGRRADFAAASAIETRYVFPSRADTFAVLQRALDANPRDATARFLLGSLHLAGGDAAAAIREWQEARRQNPRCPSSTATSAWRSCTRRAMPAPPWRSSARAWASMPANADLYRAPTRPRASGGCPARSGSRCSSASPIRGACRQLSCRSWPWPSWSWGKGEEAKALFAGRFFPREEGGTNVRQVFLEVRLRRALALARGGRAKEAITILGSIEKPVRGLAFTHDGLADFLNTARLALLKGDVYAAAGRAEEARQEWARAKDGRDGSFLKPVHVALAERRLGTTDSEAQASRLEESVAASEVNLEQGTGFPGIVLYAQGLTLRALGREEEARDRFHRVFLLPDVRLSHFLAGRALEGRDPL